MHLSLRHQCVVLKERALFVVLTVCLVLGHAGRPARGALHVYGVRDARKKSLEKIQRFRREPVCPYVVLTVCLVLGHKGRPAGDALYDFRGRGRLKGRDQTCCEAGA